MRNSPEYDFQDELRGPAKVGGFISPTKAAWVVIAIVAMVWALTGGW
jgi:hypothetical protein